MRHRIKGRKLNRTSSHRKALLSNMTNSLLKYEQIRTTLPKAKNLRPFVEKIITLGKISTLCRRRKIFSLLRDNEIVFKVLGSLAERYKERPGGYIRIIKSGYRYGDMASMAIIELIDRDISAKPKKVVEISEDDKKESN